MNDAKRIRSVSFRLTDEEYGEIEKAAVAAGDEPNNWCRQLALTAAREGPLSPCQELWKSISASSLI